MRKLKVIICGTGFGKFYLEAISRLGDQYELIGVFSRGSQESRECAQRAEVPLYTKLSELENLDIDLACIVIKSAIVGGKGTELAIHFLSQGISVLQEHPVHYTDYARCVKEARAGQCLYKLNSFYHNLDATVSFLETMKQIRKQAEIAYIKAECSIQVLFPLIDILGRMLNGFKPYTFQLLSDQQIYQPFISIGGDLKNVPVMLSVRNEMDVHRPESNIALLHRFEVGTSRGTLSLTDTHGAVLWTPHIHENLTATDNYSLASLAVQETVHTAGSACLQDIFKQLWPKSIQRSLLSYYDHLLKRENLNREHQHSLAVCQIWQELGEMLGPCHPVRVVNQEPMSLNQF